MCSQQYNGKNIEKVETLHTKLESGEIGHQLLNWAVVTYG